MLASNECRGFGRALESFQVSRADVCRANLPIFPAQVLGES